MTYIPNKKRSKENNLQYINFWHRSFTFNSNKSPTWCNSFSVYHPDVCLQLHMFPEFSRPSSGAQWLQWQPLVLPSYRGDSRAVFVVRPVGRPARPRTQHDYHHDTKVKPDAATAVIGLLMMGGKTPETGWAVNRRQDDKLKNWCTGWWFIWRVYQIVTVDSIKEL
jgi:hypothetical protein